MTEVVLEKKSPEPDDPQGDRDGGVQVAERTSVKTAKPKYYKVLLLNDDYTTMDFVVAVLETIFKRSPAEAVEIMLAVHKQGSGVAGIYPKEIAEAKAETVHEKARAAGHPLRCVVEEE